MNPMRLRTKFAIGGLILWAAIVGLAWSFYPSRDNLVVGFPVFAIQGEDALGSLRHRPGKFALVLTLAGARRLGVLHRHWQPWLSRFRKDEMAARAGLPTSRSPPAQPLRRTLIHPRPCCGTAFALTQPNAAALGARDSCGTRLSRGRNREEYESGAGGEEATIGGSQVQRHQQLVSDSHALPAKRIQVDGEPPQAGGSGKNRRGNPRLACSFLIVAKSQHLSCSATLPWSLTGPSAEL